VRPFLKGKEGRKEGRKRKEKNETLKSNPNNAKQKRK
jgi:hypothetical protein